MLLGPIFRVEVVTVARRRRYFVLRVVYGVLILMVLWGAYSSLRAFTVYGQQAVSIQQSAQIAAGFFVSFSWLQMLAILAVGPAMAVGTIATERERRTIEYLFASDLSNYEIVFGKTMARLALVGQLVLVGLPILFLFRLLGGIPARLLVVTFLFAGSTALFTTALSVCVSVWSRRSRDATVRIYLVLAALLVIPMVLHVTAGWGILAAPLWQALGAPVVEACLRINPIWTLGQAIGNQSAIGAGLDLSAIFASMGWQVLVSIGALLLATAAVRRVHLGESTRSAEESHRKRWRLPRWKLPLGHNAMIWKELFAGTAATRLGLVGNVAIALILATVFGFTVTTFLHAITRGARWNNDPYHEFVMVMTGILGTGMLLLLAARAAGLVTNEKERDCWTSLISTPLDGREIMHGKMWGNLYSVRWPLVVLLFIWSLGVVLDGSFGWAMLALVLTFVLVAWFATNLGLYLSLRSLTTLRAMGATLGTLVFVGGGYLFCCCVVMSGAGGPNDGEIMFAPCIPFLIAFPAAAYIELDDARFWGDTAMPIAYVVGIIGYLIAGTCFYAAMTARFDELAGRCGAAPDYSSSDAVEGLERSP